MVLLFLKKGEANFNARPHPQTRRDETRRDETRRDETRRDETRRDETRTNDLIFSHPHTYLFPHLLFWTEDVPTNVSRKIISCCGVFGRFSRCSARWDLSLQRRGALLEGVFFRCLLPRLFHVFWPYTSMGNFHIGKHLFLHLACSTHVHLTTPTPLSNRP